MVDGGVDAFEIEIFSLGSGVVEGESFEGTDLGDDAEEEGDNAGSEARTAVLCAPLLFIIGAAEVVEELLFGEVGLLAHHVFLVGGESDFGHVGDEATDGPAVRADGEIFVGENIFQLHSVNDGKGTLEQGLGDLESDEVVVLLWGITTLGDLHHVESELGFEVSGFVFGVGHRVAVLGA